MLKYLIYIFTFFSLNIVADDDIKNQNLKEIYQSFDELNSAVNSINVEKALENIDDRLVFVNIPGNVTKGLAGVRKYFDIMLLAKDAYLKSATFEFKIAEEPLIIDNRIALAHGHSVNHYTFSTGNKMDLPVDWTGAMIKENGKWKVISLHVAGNIFDNPIMSKIYWILGICFAITLIVSSSFFFWLGKKAATR